MKRRSNWYDGKSVKDKLKIYAARVLLVVICCIVGLAYKGLSGEPKHLVEPEEMHCSRHGWGGDC